MHCSGTHPVTQLNELVRIGAPGSVGIPSKAHHHGCYHFIIPLIRKEGVAHHVCLTLPIKVLFQLQDTHTRIVISTHKLLGSVQGNGVLRGHLQPGCTGGLYRQLRNAKAGADMSTPMAWLLYKFTVAAITDGHATGHGCLTPLSSFLVLVLPEPAYRSKSNALRCWAKAWEKQSGSEP